MVLKQPSKKHYQQINKNNNNNYWRGDKVFE